MQSAPACLRCKKGAEEAGLTAEEMKSKHNIGISRGGKNTKIHALVDGLGVATRYDKLSSMFQAFVYLACIMIWVK